MIKICHLTSVHTRNDTRIFLKECKSLVDAGYETYLVVADGKKNEVNNNIHIIDIGRKKSRLVRIFYSTYKVYKAAVKINADIYHFHDPELIPVGLLLKLKRKKVIFDIHENIVEQIKLKSWLSGIAKFIFSNLFKLINRLIARCFFLILAENSYEAIYRKYTSNYSIILNMPRVDLLNNFLVENRKGNEIFYIGGISNERGLDVVLEALNILEKKKIDLKMHFIGPVEEDINTLNYKNLKNKIQFYGIMEFNKGYEISRKCNIGISILKPVGNYITSYRTLFIGCYFTA